LEGKQGTEAHPTQHDQKLVDARGHDSVLFSAASVLSAVISFFLFCTPAKATSKRIAQKSFNKRHTTQRHGLQAREAKTSQQVNKADAGEWRLPHNTQ
jgi:hypothetical protein